MTPVLFTMDRYEEVIPNLSTGLDTETETFVETALDPGLWPAQLKVGKAWDIERSLCLVCHRETRMSNLTPLTSLDSQTRRDIKRRFPPSPDRLGICPRCRPSIEASPAEPGTGWALDTDVILRILSRGFYLVMGCFLPHTLPGAVVAEAIAHPEVGFMAPLEATLLVSAVGGALFFLIPLKTLSWPLIAPFARIGDTTSGLDRSRFLLAGTFHAGLIYLFLNGRSLNHRVGLDHLVLLLPITMTCGVGLALIVAAIGHRILNLETEDQVRMSMRIKAMGTLALSLTGLEGIRRPDELVERILVVLREGMRATRFILYSWDDERSEYLAIHVEGEREVPPRAIAPDADGIIGRALGSQRSQIRSRRASRKLSVPAIGFPDPVLVVPVTASGRVRYLLCVEEIADAAWEEDLKPLLAPVTHLFARAAGRVEEPPPP